MNTSESGFLSSLGLQLDRQVVEVLGAALVVAVALVLLAQGVVMALCCWEMARGMRRDEPTPRKPKAQ